MSLSKYRNACITATKQFLFPWILFIAFFLSSNFVKFVIEEVN